MRKKHIIKRGFYQLLRKAVREKDFVIALEATIRRFEDLADTSELGFDSGDWSCIFCEIRQKHFPTIPCKNTCPIGKICNDWLNSCQDLKEAKRALRRGKSAAALRRCQVATEKLRAGTLG